MRIFNYHCFDNWSVVKGLPTPIQLFKRGHSDEEYRELISFFYSEKWKKVERDHINSDRRYYEKRKDWYLSVDDPQFVCKSKAINSSAAIRRLENRIIDRFEDRFEDGLLAECVKALSPGQYQIIRLFCKGLDNGEIAKKLGTTANNVCKQKKRALAKVKKLYLNKAEQSSDYLCIIPFNILKAVSV